MPAWLRWVLGGVVALIVAGGPLALYRAEYAHAKRLREVTPGRFYRCGQLTAAGFRDAFDDTKSGPSSTSSTRTPTRSCP